MLIAVRTREPEETSALIPSDRWYQEISTSHSTYPVEKLKTDNIADVVRAYGQRQSHTRIQALTDPKGVDTTIDYVALIGINREVPRAPVPSATSILPNRARLIIDSTLFDTQEPPISGTNFTLTNMTGSYTILNQVINPPEETVVGYTPTSLTATNPAVDTQAIAEFDNYSAQSPLSVSSDPSNAALQRFLVHVKWSDGFVTDVPDIEVVLRQGAADIRILDYEQIERTSEGFIFTYPWDAYELPLLLNPVKIKVNGNSVGGRVPVPISILWRATVDNMVYESTPLAGNVLWYDNSNSDITNEKMLIWRPGITIPANEQYKLLIELSDFSTTSELFFPGPVSALSYTSINSAFTAGRLAAGDVIDLPLHEVGGAKLFKSGRNQGGLTESYGGHLRATRTDLTRWEAELSATPQSQTRIFGELDRLYKNLGFILPTLWMIDNADLRASLWAIIKSWESIDLGSLTGEDYPGAPTTTEQRYDLKIGIVEIQAHSTKIDQ